MDEEDDYGDIADEDLLEAFTQTSQTLPTLPHLNSTRKRRRSDDDEENELSYQQRRRSRQSTGSGVSGDEDGESMKDKKKKKWRIHVGDKEVPAAKILGATQAEALPDSSPYRIRGPIYMKPRPEPPKPPVFSTPKPPVSKSNTSLRQASTQVYNNGFDLDDIPDGAFSSQESITIDSSIPGESQENSRPRQRLAAPAQGLRQTTLFGGRAPEEVTASQAKKARSFIVDLPPESPTHHVLNQEALKTWVYPINLGAIREYQYRIVSRGLFNNTLVALPTGLGKTFIAATIMLNFYRWTKDAQIVFVAPTKPLVAQQVDACFNIVGIPKSQTTMLTGEQPPALRAEEWEDKRVFFMTPQTLENDLSSGIADPKKIVLLVVDEAHRATGNYAYVKVVKFLRRFNKSFRILALTATPGSSVESVQDVIDGLEISKVEIRTEESIDIQKYVNTRNIDQIVLDPSDEMIMIKELLSKSLQPLVDLLRSQNGYYSKDPMSLTPFGMMQARKKWFSSGAGKAASQGLKFMMHALFSVLASVAHSIKLLNFHGIRPFYSTIKDFRQMGEDNKGGGKYRKQILDHPDFRKMMDRIQMWINKDDFVGHPKLTYLCDTILNHFLDAGEGRLGENTPPSSTRVIVFSEFRDSAEDITRILNRHGPMIRASVFVGQADSKRSEGMNQAKQQETIERFKSGKINVLVATSIGEEGLDIGQVDLIVCYDASGSPIRMLQRMGRTGRKRAGNITLLLMRGKEEDNFAKAKDNYEQMQKMISSGERFDFRTDLSVRILPREIIPQADKRVVDIPIENTQGPSLPEPKRRRAAKANKKPQKKFHMPDGVETGFQRASKLTDGDPVLPRTAVASGRLKVIEDDLVEIPTLASVLLNSSDRDELQQRYQNISGDDMQEVGMPELTTHPLAQRSFGPVCQVQHGQYTRRCVQLFSKLAASQGIESRHLRPYGDSEPDLLDLDVPPLTEDESLVERQIGKKIPATAKAKRLATHLTTYLGSESAEESPPSKSKKKQRVPQHVDLPSENESEGQGDDIRDSEAPSEDDSDSGNSLDGFVVGDEYRSEPLAQSSTTPDFDTSLKTAIQRPSSMHIDTSDDEDKPDVGKETIQKPSPDPVMSSASEEDARPVETSKKRAMVIEDSDSDE